MATSKDRSSPDGIDLTPNIKLIRGQRVLVDSDLAALYGVPTMRLNEAVKRNRARFPADFAFQLTAEEQVVLISQFAISKPGRGGRRKPATVFTEHGAVMAATLLNSPLAVEMSIHVVRAFVMLRRILASNESVARRLEALERSVSALDAETRREFTRVYEAILKLMGPASSEQYRHPRLSIRAEGTGEFVSDTRLTDDAHAGRLPFLRFGRISAVDNLKE